MADPHGLRGCDSTDRENESETDSSSASSSSSSSSSNGSSSPASSSGDSDSEHESQSTAQMNFKNYDSTISSSNGPLISNVTSNQHNDTLNTKKNTTSNLKRIKKATTSPAKQLSSSSPSKSPVNSRKNASPTKNQSPLKGADSSCNLTIDDLLPTEIQVIRSIGKIKRQKQRASFIRLANILKQSKCQFPEFETDEGIKQILQQAEARGLLQQSYSENGTLSYRELGPGVAIVAQIARRKNAALLAATYNLDSSFTQEAEKSNESKEKVESPRKSNATRSPSKKQVTPREKQPSLPLKSSSPKKLCGLCRGDDSRDSLITCSVCSLSGTYLLTCYHHPLIISPLLITLSLRSCIVPQLFSRTVRENTQVE